MGAQMHSRSSKVNSINDLKPGDQISWQRFSWGISHHAIVTQVYPVDGTIKVVHSTGTHTQITAFILMIEYKFVRNRNINQIQLALETCTVQIESLHFVAHFFMYSCNPISIFLIQELTIHHRKHVDSILYRLRKKPLTRSLKQMGKCTRWSIVSSVLLQKLFNKHGSW